MSEHAIERNGRVLGRAVHPDALARLHELFPAARVTVRQIAEPKELPPGKMRMGRRTYRNPERTTRILIEPGEGFIPIQAEAICRPEDNFDRRKGIASAFRRALDTARLVREQRDVAAGNVGLRRAS